ncbi:hypothetical protein JCM16418A_01810 [Paenibacillus pini]
MLNLCKMWTMWITWWIKVDILKKGSFYPKKKAPRAMVKPELCTFYGDKVVYKCICENKKYFWDI